MKQSEEEIDASILVVEDDADMADLIRCIGDFLGARPVLTVHRAEEAIAAVRRTCPVLVLIDLAVPGSERLIPALKADPHSRQIPILALAVRTETTCAEAGQLGADECLQELDVQQIETLLTGYRALKRTRLQWK